MAFELPPVYPVSPDALRGEALLGWARALVGSGCRILQFRRKAGSDAERLEDLRALVALARPRHCLVLVDDRVDLCLLADADGVHLGQDDLPPPEARTLLGPGKVIGFSTHDRTQFLEALNLPVDYLALGPVFPTETKAGADPVVPAETQSALLFGAPMPVAAIGGVTPGNAPALYARGFASVAAIGAFAADPAGAFAAFTAARDIP